MHFVNLPCGVSIILGRNGFIWVTTTSIQDSSKKNGGFTPSLKPISLGERENISRICNCIKALAKHHVLLYDTSIYYAFEISQQYQVIKRICFILNFWALIIVNYFFFQHKRLKKY